MKAKTSKQGSLAVLIFFSLVSALMMVMALYFLYTGFNSLIRGGQSSDWPTVEGVITSSQVQTQVKTRTSGSGRRGVRRTERYTVYKPEISYRYTVDGQTYTQTHLNINGSPKYSAIDSAQAVTQKYYPGSQVKVYYNPDNPADAVLEPGGDRGKAIGSILFGAVFLGFAGAMGYAIKKLPATKDAPSKTP